MSNQEEKRAYWRMWGKAHTKQRSALSKRNNRKFKHLIIEAYGSECVCCKESAWQFLSIDHVNGGGKAHKIKLFGHSVGGWKLYRWLYKNGCPKDEFQLLCRNCNAAKSELGACPHQANFTEVSSEYNSTLSRRHVNRRQAERQLKIDTFTAYGGKCACCEEAMWQFLSIDHINGNGNKHRKKLGLSGGVQFCRWLRDNGYPSGFQILCRNCNAAKSEWKVCPHEKVAHKR